MKEYVNRFSIKIKKIYIFLENKLHKCIKLVNILHKKIKTGEIE